jgi:hypothetical protein
MSRLCGNYCDGKVGEVEQWVQILPPTKACVVDFAVNDEFNVG